MSQIDIQYLYNISSKLDRFKKKSQNLYNFRCVYCGDSQKNKTKARAYVYRSKNDLFYKCHNCGKGTTLGKLVEYVDPQLYKSYVLEKYKSGKRNSTEPDFKFKPVKFDDKVLKETICFNKIPDHPAFDMFIKQRKLEEHTDKLYVVWNFYQWVNKLIPNKFPNIKEDHPRVIIPFYDVHNKVFAFQGRAFGDEQPRYITIKLDENKRRIYGLERLDTNKKIYITEGPLDSLFLPNAIAVAGSDLEINSLKKRSVYVFDNEPRSTIIINKMKKLIEKNYNICVWPKSLKYKDINDMIIAGMSPVEIQTIIDNNTFSQLSAHQQLNNFKEV